jgi:hypothetical protein
MLDQLQLSDFTPLLHQTLPLRFTPEVTLPAELVEAREINSYSPAERKPFSLIFRTQQKKEYYQQSTCVVEHPEKGDLTLFLVPLGFDHDGMRYEAVFT